MVPQIYAPRRPVPVGTKNVAIKNGVTKNGTINKYSPDKRG